MKTRKRFFYLFVAISLLTSTNLQAKLTTQTLNVATAGTLNTLINSTEKYQIQDLTLTGTLNGTDILLIREMAGSDVNGNPTNGVLEKLDLTQVNIADGGLPYYINSVDQSAYVSNQSSITDYFLYNCSQLKEVLLPNSVSNLGQYMFDGCINLQLIKLGDQNENTWYSFCFDRCPLLSQILVSSTNKKYTSVDGVLYSKDKTVLVAFPHQSSSEITVATGVKAIDFFAFSYCNQLISITLPNSLTKIGYNSFKNCSSLTTINFPDTTLFIDYNTFENCTGIQSFNITKKMTFGQNVFKGCTNLTTVTVENDVESISEALFSECTGLTNIRLGNNVKVIGSNSFFNCSRLSAITYGANLKTIGSLAFGNCTGLTSFVIPSSVTSIANDAFSGCTAISDLNINSENYSTVTFQRNTSLKNIVFGNHVKTIGNITFTGCTGLTSVTLGDSLTAIGTEAFKDCNGLTSISFGNCLTSIGSHAFQACTALQSVTLGSSISMVSSYAFEHCTSLTSVSIGKGVKTIENGAFSFCPLTQFVVDTDNPNFSTRDGVLYNKNQTTLVIFPKNKSNQFSIPAGVRAVGNGAFNSCIDLTAIDFPNSLTTINRDAFANCSNLKSLTIPDSVVAIGTSAFINCSELENVNVGKKVTLISENAFESCTKLSTLTLGNSLRTIAIKAFSNCTSLTSVVLPNTVTTLGDEVFGECTGLISIELSNTLVALPNYLFYGCSALKSITLPASIRTIGLLVFKCSDLEQIQVNDENPNFCSVEGVLFSKDKTKLVAFPNKKANSYNIPDNTVDVLSSAFNCCSNLESVTIPNSLLNIGDYAFGSCTGLDTLCIPSNVTNVGLSAFYNCSGLKSLTLLGDFPLTQTYTFIAGCFEDCTSLMKIFCNQKIARAISPATFRNVDKDLCTLYVPAGSVNSYRSNSIWNQFTNIVENATASLSTNETETAECYSEPGTIVLTGLKTGESITIFDVLGKCICQTKADGNQMRIQLASDQIYLIRTKSKAYKLAL